MTTPPAKCLLVIGRAVGKNKYNKQIFLDKYLPKKTYYCSNYKLVT